MYYTIPSLTTFTHTKIIIMPKDIQQEGKHRGSKSLFMPRESLVCLKIFNSLVELEEKGLVFFY